MRIGNYHDVKITNGIFVKNLKMKKSLRQFLKSKNYTKIKLKLTKTNHFEIKAKINGIKGRFIVDTGASNSCVDFSATEQFNLEVKESDVKAAGAGDANMETKISKRNQITIGAWKTKRATLILFNLSHVNTALANHNAKPVDGVIGADILKKGKAIIDYKKQHLYLKL